MMGRDHALSGALAFAALAVPLHMRTEVLAAGMALTAGAAVLPDIDHPDASIAQTFGWVTKGFAWAVEHVSGGHRHGTHSLAGAAVFTAAASVITHYGHSPGRPDLRRRGCGAAARRRPAGAADRRPLGGCARRRRRGRVVPGSAGTWA